MVVTTYSYDGKSVSLSTRDKLGSVDGVKKNLTSADMYGAVVATWATKYANLSAAQKANLDALQATADGTFAVKYHVDYARVLEDALNTTVVEASTKILFYGGSIDIDTLAAAMDTTTTPAGPGEIRGLTH